MNRLTLSMFSIVVASAIVGCDSDKVVVFDPVLAEAGYTPEDDPGLDMDSDEMDSRVDWGDAGQYLTSKSKLDDVLDSQSRAKTSLDQTGQWSATFEWPLAAIHAAVLPDGRVMTYGTDAKGTLATGFTYDIWDPTKGTRLDSHVFLPEFTETNAFCGGQTLLGNGNGLLISGGDMNYLPDGSKGNGNMFSSLFKTQTSSIELTGKMASARWYPTVKTLPDGRAVVLGGRAIKPTTGRSYGEAVPEIYNPNTGKYTLLDGVSNDMLALSWYYPRAFVGNKGNLFIQRAGRDQIWELDWKNNSGLKTVLDVKGGKGTNQQLPAAMYRPGKVLELDRAGGARILDITQSTPKVTQVDGPGEDRIFSDLTVLANGGVLLTGGSAINQDLDSAYYSAKLWSPGSQTWKTLASASRSRLYHSTAVLLQDGRVLVAGGGSPGPVTNMNAEIFSPPYLFAKDGSGELADRPRILSHSQIELGKNFTIKASGAIQRVGLVRTSSVTHSFNVSQRFVGLGIVSGKGDANGSLVVRAPANSNIAPPGAYMLVVMDEQGTPSVASMVEL